MDRTSRKDLRLRLRFLFLDTLYTALTIRPFAEFAYIHSPDDPPFC